MSAHDTEEAAASPAAPTARPSWEAAAPAPRPAAPPRPAFTPHPTPRPAPAASAETSRPYYAAAPSPTSAPPPATPDQGDEVVQYDLAGNPVPSAAPRAAAYAPPTPLGYSAGTVASWPPPVGGLAPGGSRNTSGEAGEVPPEIARLTWNWGAFFFPVMWCRKHGLAMEANVLRYSFLALIVLRMALHGISPTAFVVLGALYGAGYSVARLYLALKGHQMGWRSRHFPGGVAEYFQVQKAWMWWGFGISAAWTVVLPVVIFLGALGAGLSMQHHQSYSSPYGGYSRHARPWPNSANTTPGGSGSATP